MDEPGGEMKHRQPALTYDLTDGIYFPDGSLDFILGNWHSENKTMAWGYTRSNGGRSVNFRGRCRTLRAEACIQSTT
jgi:hypothetical protein